MKGLNAKDILTILDLIYYGEVKVNQEDLNQFLVIAEEFELNGMSVVGDKKEIPSLNPKKKQEIILNEILTNNKPDIIIPNTLMKREIPISEPQILKEGYDNEPFSEGEKEILEEEIEGKKESKRKHRLDWEVANEYNTREEFELSEWKQKLKDFVLRSGQFTNVVTYCCKFGRRKGYTCAVQIRVRYAESSDHIYVETVNGNHNHEKQYINVEENPNYLKSTEAQTDLVMLGVINNATPAMIKKQLNYNIPDGKMPTANQLANKIAHCKKIMFISKTE